MKFWEQYLRESVVSKETIDTFLDRSALSWAQFDPELGYTLGNSTPRDGLGGCSTISTSQKNGARSARMYVEKPCRINTYGNSFTLCHQVSDGETWQEYLAAHFGEPIRNFGMGGYGVYQAYRRMVRTEQAEDGAKHVIFYIWGDDHHRSLMRCRHAVTYSRWKGRRDPALFHNNFWANIEMDLESGQFAEKPNLLSTPESLYKMTDPDFMHSALKDDLMVQLYAIIQSEVSDTDSTRLDRLAEVLGVPGIEEGDSLRASAERIRDAYGFAATKHILRLVADFCRTNNRELMIFLLCPQATQQLLHGQSRYDQCIVNHLDQAGMRYFDMNRIHLEDYKKFNLSVPDYMKRYFMGHYSPAGNHFFAYSAKDTLVEWLNPKPVTYRDEHDRIIDFKGYLPD